MVVNREKGNRDVVKGRVAKYMVMKDDLTLGGAHAIQYTDHMS